MPSTAHAELTSGLAEVRLLRGFVRPQNTVPLNQRREWTAARTANNRACVVLLCSHYERFIYALNEAATDHLNAALLTSDQIPEKIRLLQTKKAVEDVALQQWELRSKKLEELAAGHLNLWTPGARVTALQPGATLAWMKSPKVGDVSRFFSYYGLDRIMARLTRTEGTRRDLSRRLQSLVDSRNGIAHGDSTVQPSRSDVTEYLDAVAHFARGADRELSKSLAKIASTSRPW